MITFKVSGTTPDSGTYPNNEAFSEATKLAARHEKFNCILDIVDGIEVARIESKTKTRFSLQLNEAIVNWLFDYLRKGENSTLGIDPNSIDPSDEPDGNTYRKHMLQYICEQKVARSVQFTPEFRERTSGKFSAIANFNFGTIYFYMDRDEEIKAWAEEQENRGE